MHASAIPDIWWVFFFFLCSDFFSLGTVSLIKRALNSSFTGPWLHIFLLRKVWKLLWLRDRSLLWMVWQLAFLSWRCCWRTTQTRLSWLVLLPLLYCRIQRPLFEQYTGKWGTRKKSLLLINVLIEFWKKLAISHLGNSVNVGRKLIGSRFFHFLCFHARHSMGSSVKATKRKWNKAVPAFDCLGFRVYSCWDNYSSKT